MKNIAPESTLILEMLEEIQPKIENIPEIFRYFNTEEDRQNFISGKLLFATPTKNRFLQESHNGISDPWEYRNISSTFLYESSLSFSREYIDDSKFNIRIVDVPGFINEIAASLTNSGHKAVWITAEEYERLAEDPEFITFSGNSDIKIDDLKYIKDVSLSIIGLGGRSVIYVDKIVAADDPRVKEYSSEKMVYNAHCQNSIFDGECEYKIYINASEFFSNNKLSNLPTGLLNLAKYIVLSCPKVGQYCEKV